MSAEDGKKAEILIIRRSGGEGGDGHHGGAWKIAYADFVTAMMAFFLVMWLINSANEATRARVASYFNPIKLTDATPGSRDLKDLNNTKKPESKAKQETQSGTPGNTVSPNKDAKIQNENTASNTDGELLSDPFKAIDAISKEGTAHPTGRSVEVVSQKVGDPFDPQAWEALRAGQPQTQPPPDSATLPALEDQNPNDEVVESSKTGSGVAIDASAENSVSAVPSPMQKDAKSADAKDRSSSVSVVQSPQKLEPPVESTLLQQKLIDTTKAQIQAAILDAQAEDDLSFAVKLTSEGLLVTLGDKNTKPMFKTGSAKPSLALIEVVSAIGKVLEKQQGAVVIRGHTDAHQFKNLSFDNWQLSTARAHIASYILIRSGLDSKRIGRIEGYGSNDPLNAKDPYANENRRVEFLLHM